MYLQTPNIQFDRSRRPINRVGTRKKNESYGTQKLFAGLHLCYSLEHRL
jgi:hypothetical protein